MRKRVGALLVVDDDESNRSLLCRYLLQQGYEVKTAENAAQALDWIGKSRLDLVLLDAEMPGMGGLEVLTHLRKTRSRLQLPVIMVTDMSYSEDAVKGLALGADDYITKPMDLPVVAARIETHLSLKWTQEALLESEERYALAACGANDGIWDWDLKSDEIYFSSRWKSMLGYEEHEISNRIGEWLDRVHPEDIEELRARIHEHLEGGANHFETEHRILHRDGAYRRVVSRGLAVRDDTGHPTRMAGSQRDVTTERMSDPLTGLPNRLLFMDRLGCLLERAKRQSEYLCAVLFLDLDSFHVVNDSLGHQTGDKLLIAVSRRLESCLRSGDTVSRFSGVHTMARIGGDQFCILLDDIKNAANATRVAERMLNELASPFDIGGQEIFASACIGIALNKPGHQKPEVILRDSETAKNWARVTGKARYEVFDPLMRHQALTRLQLETELRRALERQELQNYYQIIVSTAKGQIVGFEALMRWQHPSKGIVPPNEFIPLAEETGLILDIGRQGLQAACRQLSAWEKLFGAGRSLVMSVNLSCRQLMQGELLTDIYHVLKETGLDPKSLKLEVTESSIMQDVAFARSMLHQLREMGIRVAIDDFGTGYSSLSYLNRFPVDTLKIDRSFVSRIGTAGNNAEIIATIIAMAHNLGLDVVAEGVETAEQLAQLGKLDCDYVQGFYLAGPMDARAMETVLSLLAPDEEHPFVVSPLGLSWETA